MLCQFSFKNYKSFKDESMLDFYAEAINENKDSLIVDEYDKEEFLPVAVIYGPNGGGKSNVLEALYYLFLFVLNHILIFRQPNNPVRNDTKVLMGRPKFHAFDEKCRTLPVSFEILFRQDGETFKYELSIINNKIIEENLYCGKTGTDTQEIVFERNKNGIKTGEVLKGIAANNINELMPYISHLAINYQIPKIEKIINWFLHSEFLNYSNPIQDTQIIIPEKGQLRKKMMSMIYSMGIRIDDARVEKGPDGRIINLLMKHKLSDGSYVELPLEEESAGTIKIFGFFARLLSALESGKLVVIDELDAKLHPKLLEYIIKLFTNKAINKKGAQLLLTSHDISTMNSTVFRRDEIWFCAMNPDSASNLYSLSSFRKEDGKKVRNDESYGKQYLEGRYGADPYFRKMVEW